MQTTLAGRTEPEVRAESLCPGPAAAAVVDTLRIIGGRRSNSRSNMPHFIPGQWDPQTLPHHWRRLGTVELP